MIKDKQPLSPTRRNAIKMMAFFATILSAPFVLTPSKAYPRYKGKIVVRDAGGSLTKAFADVFCKPFTQATGIQVVAAASEPEPIAQIQTMVETKRYLWDIAVISDRAILYLTTGNVYLEKHKLVDPILS